LQVSTLCKNHRHFSAWKIIDKNQHFRAKVFRHADLGLNIHTVGEFFPSKWALFDTLACQKTKLDEKVPLKKVIGKTKFLPDVPK
jgi:hypothetical protein